MAPLPGIDFEKNTQGLGTTPARISYKSGIGMWADIAGNVRSYPSGFTAADNIKQFFSLQEVEDAGITGDSSNDWNDLHYHAAEFFRIAGNSELWIGIFDNSSVVWSDIREIQYEAEGELFQISAYIANLVSQSALVTNINNFHSELVTLEGEDMPAVGLLAVDHSGVSAGNMGSTLPDLTSETAHRVANVISEDGAAAGATLAANQGYSLTDIGAKMGSLSRLAVHLNIGFVQEMNMSDGVELDVPALANGELVRNVSSSQLETLHDNHHIFLRKYVNYPGTYNTYSWTAIAQTDDLSELEAVRVFDKAMRFVRRSLTSTVNGPIYVNDDGTIDEGSIGFYEGNANDGLDPLIEDENVGSAKAIIKADQDVVAQGGIRVAIELNKVRVASTITVPIQYV